MVKWKLVAISPILMTVIANSFSCSQLYDFENEEIEVETVQQPLSNLSAQLKIKIKSDYNDTDPLQLCIGSEDNCYDLIDDAEVECIVDGGVCHGCRQSDTDSYDSWKQEDTDTHWIDKEKYCVIATWEATPEEGTDDTDIAQRQADDHPFVNHPDDWDNMLGKVC